jgi:hypothetical protein
VGPRCPERPETPRGVEGGGWAPFRSKPEHLIPPGWGGAALGHRGLLQRASRGVGACPRPPAPGTPGDPPGRRGGRLGHPPQQTGARSFPPFVRGSSPTPGPLRPKTSPGGGRVPPAPRARNARRPPGASRGEAGAPAAANRSISYRLAGAGQHFDGGASQNQKEVPGVGPGACGTPGPGEAGTPRGVEGGGWGTRRSKPERVPSPRSCGACRGRKKNEQPPPERRTFGAPPARKKAREGPGGGPGGGGTPARPRSPLPRRPGPSWFFFSRLGEEEVRVSPI